MDTAVDIVLIDKPVGISSFDVIRRLRREYKDRNLTVPKMGHAGTLDPLASGLMLVGIGAGTKKLAEYLKLPKEYVTEILIGEKRTTGDMEGRIVESKDVVTLSEADTKTALTSMIGELTLPVSAYSAIKKDGIPMYKRARIAEQVGETVADVAHRSMGVLAAEHLGQSCAHGRCVIQIRFSVTSGTYIRSLGEELGRRLGYPATVQSLRRTKVGEFSVDNARSI